MSQETRLFINPRYDPDLSYGSRPREVISRARQADPVGYESLVGRSAAEVVAGGRATRG